MYLLPRSADSSVFFFFNDTATTEIYTLSLHDALPICSSPSGHPTANDGCHSDGDCSLEGSPCSIDRKSTRLNSSHGYISYAVFCLKKKKNTVRRLRTQTPTRRLLRISPQDARLHFLAR